MLVNPHFSQGFVTRRVMADDPYAGFADLFDSEAGFPEIQDLYIQWRNHLKGALRQFQIPARILVDLACGTGNSTIPWTRSIFVTST